MTDLVSAPAKFRRPATRIREVAGPEDSAVTPAYALLTSTFPREECVTLHDWLGSLKEKSGRMLTDIAWHLLVAEQDGKVVGLTSGTYLGNVNIGVIGYLAITPEARSGGIGTRLRGRLRKLIERDALRIAGRPLDAIIGEVSARNPWLRNLNRSPNVLVLDFPYCQPQLYEGDRPSPFFLYYESLQRPRQSLPVAELRRILYTMWRRVYRVSRPLDRPAFRAMLRAIKDRRTIGGRKLK